MQSILKALALIGVVGYALTQIETESVSQTYEDAYATLQLGAVSLDSKIDIDNPSPGDKCPDCNGTGRVGDRTHEFPCDRCHGTGRITEVIIKQTATQVCIDTNGDGVIDQCVSAASYTPPARAVSSPSEDSPRSLKKVTVKQRYTYSCPSCPGGVGVGYKYVTKYVDEDGNYVSADGEVCECGCGGNCGGTCGCEDCVCSQSGTSQPVTSRGSRLFNRDVPFMQRGPIRNFVRRLPIIRRFCR